MASKRPQARTEAWGSFSLSVLRRNQFHWHLASELQPPEPWGSNLLTLKPLSLWHFVVAALAAPPQGWCCCFAAGGGLWEEAASVGGLGRSWRKGFPPILWPEVPWQGSEAWGRLECFHLQGGPCAALRLGRQLEQDGAPLGAGLGLCIVSSWCFFFHYSIFLTESLWLSIPAFRMK